MILLFNPNIKLCAFNFESVRMIMEHVFDIPEKSLNMNEVPTELTIILMALSRFGCPSILVSRMHLATMALLCKQTTDNSRTSYPPEPKWRHLLGNRILFVPHST